MQCLADNINENGLLQPISVRKTEKDTYQLVAGERRLRAFKMLGRQSIPCIICTYEDMQSAALCFAENYMREDLNYFEQAKAMKELIAMWDCTQEAAALRFGIAQPTLANKLRLLSISEKVQSSCLEYNLTERHSRALLKLENDNDKIKAISIIYKKNLNVTQTEQLIDNMLSCKPKAKQKRNVMIKDVRIFINTINRAISIMKNSGVDATAEKSETNEYIEYVVRIPTKATPLR